ncbi:MAG: hypothetical protein JW939_00445 [Candidatus Thermoplasmatota archaeon]|nr:hypothetical protein [Candidatus Thermoplasmatota archaeon]
MIGLPNLERNIVIGGSVITLLALNVLFYLLFPIYEEFGGWVLEGLRPIPFLIWVPVGGLLGYLINMGMRKKRELMASYSRRVMVGIVGWFFLSVLVSLMTETGDLFTRLEQGPLFKAWTVLMFVLLSVSPNVFGVYSIFSRKRWSIGAAISMFFFLAMICMVFSQGRYALALEQDPVLSLLFVWAAVMFIETLSWTERYLDRGAALFPDIAQGNTIAVVLLRRQVFHTLVIVGVSSIFTILPVVLVAFFPEAVQEYVVLYETGTVYGMAVFGLILMLPLMILAFVRRWRDRRSASFNEVDEEIA